MKTVARISVSPVKGFRLVHPEEVELGPDGVAENRRFFLAGPPPDQELPWAAREQFSFEILRDILLPRPC